MARLAHSLQLSQVYHQVRDVVGLVARKAAAARRRALHILITQAQQWEVLVAMSLPRLVNDRIPIVAHGNVPIE